MQGKKEHLKNVADGNMMCNLPTVNQTEIQHFHHVHLPAVWGLTEAVCPVHIVSDWKSNSVGAEFLVQNVWFIQTSAKGVDPRLIKGINMM